MILSRFFKRRGPDVVESFKLLWRFKHPVTDTITDGVFSHIAQYKKYGHNNSTNCEKKYMTRKLWTSSTSSYNFCPSKTMLKHWNGLKEMDLAFSHFCHARVTQNPIGTSQIFDPGMSPQTDALSRIDIVSIKDRVKQSVPYSQNV